jgi:RNA polymerase-binding transcription factor DksA
MKGVNVAKKTKKSTTKKKAAKKAAPKKTTKKKAKKKVVKPASKTAKKKTSKKKTVAKKKAVKKQTAKKKVAKKKTVVKKKATKKKAAKKTVKKAAPKKPKIKKRKSALSAKELEYFRNLLMEKQKEIVGDVNAMESEALRKSRLDASGDLSSMPIHMADMGTDNFEQEFSLGLMDSERNILIDIVRALNKIDVGTFGICEGTGKLISKPRLEANPWARYCIEYATMVEKGLVIEGERTDDYEEPEELSDEFNDEIEDDSDNEKTVYDLFEDDDEKEAI